MVKFSEINESIKEVNNFERISKETGSSMSDQEVENYWKSEFKNVKDNREIYPEEMLIAEAFNRFEDEISIDFDIDKTIVAIVENFEPQKWDKLNEAQKVNIAKETVRQIGEKLDLKDIPILSFYDGVDGDCGAYIYSKNTIEINRRYFNNPMELLNTLTHELRHAYQRNRAEKIETWEDKIIKTNFDYYISPIPLPDGNYLFFTDYQNQFVEVDARAFANIFTEAMKR